MDGETMHVLVVEDNPGDFALLRRSLRNNGMAYDIAQVTSLAEALERLASETPDVVLLDLSLPDSHGLATFDRIRERRPDIPVVVLTGFDDEAAATEAVKGGAQDYLVKGSVDVQVLSRALRYAIERHQMQQELKALAITDDLTGLLNRRGFEPVAEQQLRVAEREREPVSLLFLDIDGLKRANDTYGHAEGSFLIAEAGEVIRRSIRVSDVAARIGGDEFCVLLAGDDRAIDTVLDRLHDNVRVANDFGDRPSSLSLSVGVATSTAEFRLDLGELLALADERMYADKQARRVAR